MDDSRQSLFSELIIRYAEELNRKEYIQRGLAALYASFEMMYCPENSATKEQWEKVWSFFNEKDYGFMMENYGHGGVIPISQYNAAYFHFPDFIGTGCSICCFIGLSALTPEMDSGQAIVNSKFAMRHFE